jgi:hypothetical protein
MAASDHKLPRTFATATEELASIPDANVAIAGMRHIAAVIDDRGVTPRGGCTFSKQTPRPAAVASEVDKSRHRASFFEARKLG